MLDMLREGGTFAWIAVCLGMLALGLSVAYLVTSEAVLRWICVGALAATAMAGVAGWWNGRQTTDMAVATVDPQMAEELRRAGYAESDRPWQLAAPFVLLGAVLFAVAEQRRRSKLS